MRSHRENSPTEASHRHVAPSTATTRIFAYRKMPHYNIYVVSGVESERGDPRLADQHGRAI